jgi:hypothetical protein
MNQTNWPFIVENRPFYPLGGQVHNSSAHSQDELTAGWKALAAIHANTAEIPVYWEQVESQEGQLNFQQIDWMLEGARQNGLKLVLLWFGTWKNGTMKYAPEWVKDDPQRFHRIITPHGMPIAVLSPHCEETLAADRKAFCAMIEYISQHDIERTVISVQVENEPGILGSDRDYSEMAERLFQSPLSKSCIDALNSVYAKTQELTLPIPVGDCTWTDLFGTSAGEYFTAWHIAQYIDSIAAAGKKIYNLPMYINVWPQEARWRIPGGTYPSGGATTNVVSVWKAAAPNIDLIALDTYILNTRDYCQVCEVYERPDNPLFIPESARHPANALNMFHAIGTYNAIGYAVFGVDSLVDKTGTVLPNMQPLADSFKVIKSAIPLLTKYHKTGRIHAVVEEEFRTEQFFDLGSYIGFVIFGQSDSTLLWTDYHHATAPRQDRGRGLIVQTDDDEFFVVGAGFRLLLKKKGSPETMMSSHNISDYLVVRLTNYRRVEEGHFTEDDQWVVDRLRSGDETDYGIWVQPDVGLVRVVMGD